MSTGRARVRVPAPLRRFTGGEPELTVDGATVGELISRLVADRPGLARHLLSPEGKLRSFVTLYLNDEDVRYLEREKTPVKDGDVLSIVPSIAGGVPAERPAPVPPAPGAGGALPPAEIRRYSRHLLLPEVGLEGQLRLRAAKVLIVGAGGLGAPAALYLAAAGVGEIGLVDFDTVDASNLQRQVLFSSADIGRPKLRAAEERLRGLNPEVRVTVHEGPLARDNAREILAPYDVVLDGTDNFPTRYLVNDACVLMGKPNVYGSVYRFEGQASVFDARVGPCYRCLYPEPPPPGLVPSCGEAGVLGVLPGLIGLIQATEAIKLLLGTGEPLIGRLLLYDALGLRFRELRLRKSPDCVLCGPRATQHELVDYPAFCGVAAPGTGESTAGVPEVSAEELAAELGGPEPPRLVDVREPGEWAIVRIAGAELIPQAALADRVAELAGSRAIVVYCKSGARSAQATRLLLELGFTNVRNLAGGIDRWAERVDPSLPRY